MKNIVLIGMPAAGKSTIGVILAKTLGFEFIDTDLIIQKQTGRLLQEIIDNEGLDKFCMCEEKAVMSVKNKGNAVVATGGSAVYSRDAMKHLKKTSVIYYLALPTEELLSRLHNIKTRGIAMRPGETVDEVFAHRKALYEEYADITVDCFGKSTEELVAEIMDYHRIVGLEEV